VVKIRPANQEDNVVVNDFIRSAPAEPEHLVSKISVLELVYAILNNAVGVSPYEYKETIQES